MPQSIHECMVHIIFSTKHRAPVLQADVRPPLFAYMAGILKNLECYSIHIGGVEDHVHICCSITKKRAPMYVLQAVKQDSSKWIKTKSDRLKHFHWQDGYGLFSVSPAHVPALHTYIDNQEQHHRTETFQGELHRILRTYGVAFDERYIWD